jgi:hypothetical protein
MSSPFPGMDPWLERPGAFPDLHNSLITKLGDVINLQLPPPYYATSGTRAWIDQSLRFIEPDVDVLYPAEAAVKAPNDKRKTSARAGVATEPLRVHVSQVIEHDESSEWFLEIYAKPDNEHLVTTIEVLSISNKRPGHKGRDLYQKKQDETLKKRVHLVEIDLLRGGAHTTAVARSVIEEGFGPFDYHVCVRQFDEPDDFLIYPWQLQTPLPRISIPLLPGDPPVVVDLQVLLDECYDVRNYARRAGYRTKSPEPPLSKKQKQWAEKILKSKGL